MSYLLGFDGVVHITGPDGKTVTLAGMPVVDLPSDQAVAASLVTDSDALYAPGVAAGSVGLVPAIYTDPDVIYAPTASAGAITLSAPLVTDSDSTFAADVAASGATLSVLPPLVTDADSTLRPLVDVQSPPTHGSTSHFRPAAFTDADTIYAASVVSARLSPALVSDVDTIYAAATSALNTLRPALVPADDGIYVPGVVNILLGLGPSLVPSDDAVFAFAATLFLAPSLVSDADAIAHADVGWRLFVNAPVTDADQIFGVHVESYADILPGILVEDDVESTYAFFLHDLEGGTPMPEKPHLSGSLKPKLHVLTGSLSRPKTLTGSLKHNRRILSGSLGARYGSSATKKPRR